MTAQSELVDTFEKFSRLCISLVGEGQVDQLLELDQSFTEVKSLIVLSRVSDPIPITELASRLRLSAATAGRTVDRLVRDQLVTRTEDENDRRIKRVAITEAGRETVENHFEWHRATMRSVCEQVRAADATHLTHALQPLIAAAENLYGQETRND